MLNAQRAGLLDGEEAAVIRDELKAHAARRAEMNQRKREIKEKYPDGSPESIAERDKLKEEMSKLNSEHEKFMSNLDVLPPGHKVRDLPTLKRRGDKKDPELRKAKVVNRLDGIYSKAQEAGFDEDELLVSLHAHEQAIRTTISRTHGAPIRHP